MELIDEQLAMMGLEPPIGLAIRHESEFAEDDCVAELLAVRDRVLARVLLLDSAVARYAGLTSKLLLDKDSINRSVDVGVLVAVWTC